MYFCKQAIMKLMPTTYMHLLLTKSYRKDKYNKLNLEYRLQFNSTASVSTQVAKSWIMMLNNLKSNVRIWFKIIYENTTMSTRVTLHLHLLAGNMLLIQRFFVKSCIAHFTIESIYPSMFRLVIFLPLSTRENLAAELAGKSAAFMASHVQLVM